jgi:hypothetical protein
MGLPLFWLFILAACLLWSATFSAAAARSARFPGLLSLAAWLIPVLLLVPAVALTRFLASGPKPYAANAFTAAVTLLLAAFIGGVWITIAGRQPSAHGTPVARRWPVIGLAGLCGMAAMVAYGTLLAIDNAVTAEAVQARLEAAALIQANLPPAVADADNAAPLHRQAAALVAGDYTFKRADFFSDLDESIDIRSPENAALLARHANTLDLIRRAADKNACRFDRDWSRPSIGMLLPEIRALRDEARLLALAARRAAADGDAAAAVADTVRIHRLACQADVEPIMISHLVSLGLDSLARNTLARVLPSLEADDVALLDDPGLDGVVGPPPLPLKWMLGEEALVLSVFANIATGRMEIAEIASWPGETIAYLVVDRFSLLYRTLFLRDELAAYRKALHERQEICDHDEGWISALRRVRHRQDMTTNRESFFAIFDPSFQIVFEHQLEATAGARAAQVLIAATKRRLAGGGLPESLDDLVPDQLSAVPRDPYTDNKQPLRSKLADGGIVVWGVGLNSEDDGGPTGHDSDSGEARDYNDDSGLWLVPDRRSATPVEAAAE